MKRVVIESPYAGDVARNVAYVKRCVLDCLKRGEAPYASHLFFTQDGLLDDSKVEERKLGIEAGLAWGRSADTVAFYVDLGWSDGMCRGYGAAIRRGARIEFRALDRPVNEVAELTLALSRALSGGLMGSSAATDRCEQCDHTREWHTINGHACGKDCECPFFVFGQAGEGARDAAEEERGSPCPECLGDGGFGAWPALRTTCTACGGRGHLGKLRLSVESTHPLKEGDRVSVGHRTATVLRTTADPERTYTDWEKHRRSADASHDVREAARAWLIAEDINVSQSRFDSLITLLTAQRRESPSENHECDLFKRCEPALVHILRARQFAHDLIRETAPGDASVMATDALYALDRACLALGINPYNLPPSLRSGESQTSTKEK